jgi:hypothetical protein
MKLPDDRYRDVCVSLTAVVLWLEGLADSKERRARGDLGMMFADSQAAALREAARILREHPEVVAVVDITVKEMK